MIRHTNCSSEKDEDDQSEYKEGGGIISHGGINIKYYLKMKSKELGDSKNVWKGPAERFVYSEKTSIGEILFNSMAAFPSNICQVFIFRIM